MKIVSIFAEKLFAFQYEGEVDNEYDKSMELWTNINFLKAFAKENNIVNVKKFINDILQNAEQIQDFLDNLSQNKEHYGFYFEPLQESENKKILGFQKGKIKKNRLRYYAIKLDKNCFVITGGAIKMSQTMQVHSDTIKELKKLELARAYLKENGVIDEDSFFELIIEQK